MAAKINFNQKGASIIAVIAIMLILAVMGAALVSLVTTGSDVSVNQLQSEQALYIAEGGKEFESRNLAINLDWYTSATDPMTATTLNLGAGSFTVSSKLPATKLTAQVTLASTNPIRVYTVNRYPTNGCILIDAEYITYTGVGSTAVACSGNPPCFTGTTRGAGACYGGGTNAAHSRGAAVYPATTLTQALPANCTSITFTIASNSKFLTAGTLNIEGEEIAYGGSNTSGITTTLTGVQRCMGTITNMAHASGVPVTPILVGGDTASFQAEIVSTGTVSSAVRVIRKTTQR